MPPEIIHTPDSLLRRPLLLSHRLTFGLGSHLLARAIAKVDHTFNRYLTERHKHTQRQAAHSQPTASMQPSLETDSSRG